MKKAKFTLQKKLIGQVRYYEELYLITNIENGDKIFASGSQLTAEKYLKILNAVSKGKKK